MGRRGLNDLRFVTAQSETSRSDVKVAETLFDLQLPLCLNDQFSQNGRSSVS
jgi:hypothetical protein